MLFLVTVSVKPRVMLLKNFNVKFKGSILKSHFCDSFMKELQELKSTKENYLKCILVYKFLHNLVPAYLLTEFKIIRTPNPFIQHRTTTRPIAFAIS